MQVWLLEHRLHISCSTLADYIRVLKDKKVIASCRVSSNTHIRFVVEKT